MWSREVDLLVFGSGVAGMTAAVVAANEGLQVLLCEKTALIGGLTSTSGGAAWVVATTQSVRAGVPDTVAAGRKYLDGEVGDFGPRALREAFYASGSEAIDYLERNTEVKYRVNNPYPDYHAEQQGGVMGGRTMAPLPFDGKLLGDDFALLRPPRPEFMVLGGMMVGRDEIKHLIRPWTSMTALKITTRLVFSYLRDRLSHPRGTRLLLGNALCGRLLYSLRKTGADIAVSAPLVELVREGGRIAGAVVSINGKLVRVRARHGVVLATGGCGASERWQQDLAPEAAITHTLAFDGNSGDGLDAGVAVGGDIDRNHKSPFFWMPASVMPWSNGRVATYPHIRDRPKPGLIAVNSAGRRFVNEGNSYNDFVSAMYKSHADGVPSIPAWLVCDRRFVREYGIGVIHPVWQNLGYFERKGYLKSAPTLAALAQKIGVDVRGLEETVREHNHYAATGVDEAFGKGSFALNRYNGDAANKPNPCLAPIVKAPYYAVQVYPAPIGSSAGLRTDGDGVVLDARGKPIDGLYACGNDMSSIMGGLYPGPGITIGPAVVFAYRVAMHATRSRADATREAVPA